MGKCNKNKIEKNDWVIVSDIKNRHFNTEGAVTEIKKNRVEVELDEGNGNQIWRTFNKKQLKKLRC